MFVSVESRVGPSFYVIIAFELCLPFFVEQNVPGFEKYFGECVRVPFSVYNRLKTKIQVAKMLHSKLTPLHLVCSGFGTSLFEQRPELRHNKWALHAVNLETKISECVITTD